jgi:hypothetical protein
MSEFRETHEYPASLETVFEMFCDPAWLREKYAALGNENVELLRCEREGERFIIRCRRDVPANVPGFARRFLSAMNTVEQQDEWIVDGGEILRGTRSVDVKGTPIEISGTTTLEPSDAGCTNLITGKARVSVPLVGKRIAAFVAEDALRNLAEEHRRNLEQLASR